MTTTKFNTTAKNIKKAENFSKERIHKLVRHQTKSNTKKSNYDLVIQGDSLVNPGLNQYQIEKLIEWRNSASKRVDKYDAEIRLISNQIASLMSSLKKTKKRRESDAIWIRRIHKNLHKRIFKTRQ